MSAPQGRRPCRCGSARSRSEIRPGITGCRQGRRVIGEARVRPNTSPPPHVRARHARGHSSASKWTGTRVPRNAGFPPMILPINRSLIGARVERISSARAPEMCRRPCSLTCRANRRLISVNEADARAAQGLAPHPPLRIVRQWQSRHQHRTGASSSPCRPARNGPRRPRPQPPTNTAYCRGMRDAAAFAWRTLAALIAPQNDPPNGQDSQIIWAKNNFAIGRGHYHCKHEPCWWDHRTSTDGETSKILFGFRR
jgi:hypothetical protein